MFCRLPAAHLAVLHARTRAILTYFVVKFFWTPQSCRNQQWWARASHSAALIGEELGRWGIPSALFILWILSTTTLEVLTCPVVVQCGADPHTSLRTCLYRYANIFPRSCVGQESFNRAKFVISNKQTCGLLINKLHALCTRLSNDNSAETQKGGTHYVFRNFSLRTNLYADWFLSVRDQN